MPKNPYSSAHFLPKIDSTIIHSNYQDDSQDMSRTLETRDRRRPVDSNKTLKISRSQCLSQDRAQATAGAVDLMTTSPDFGGASLEQDTEDGIAGDSYAWNSNFAQQKLTSSSSLRTQTRGTTDIITTTDSHEAQNISSHGRTDGVKQYTISGIRKPRFERHTCRRFNSSIPGRISPSDNRSTTWEICSISGESRPVCKACQNTNTELPSHRDQFHIDNEHQDSYIQIIDNSIIPEGLPGVPSKHLQTRGGTTTNTLYHDFIKEVSHAQSNQHRSRQHPAQSVVKNPAIPETTDSIPSNNDLISLPEFTVDPCDLTSSSRSGSLKRQITSPEKAQTEETEIDLLYDSMLQVDTTGYRYPRLVTGRRKRRQHIPQAIDSEDSIRNCSQNHFQTQRYPPLTPPKTPDSSRNSPFSHSSSLGMRTSEPCLLPSSLNSSHQHNLLMLRANDPYQRSLTPTPLTKSVSIATRSPTSSTPASSSSSEADIQDKDDRMSNSFYTYDIPSLSDLSDLSLTLSTISETHTASPTRSEDKGLLEFTIPTISKQSSLSGTTQTTNPDTQSPQSRRTSKELNKTLDPTSRSPSLDHELLYSSTLSTTLTPESDSTLRDLYPNPTAHSQEEHTRRNSTDSAYEPCPPPQPISRSRPIPRILHPAPWLEDGKSLQGRLEGLLGSEALSWTEVWAAHDGDSGRGGSRQTSRMKNGLRKVLGRL